MILWGIFLLTRPNNFFRQRKAEFEATQSGQNHHFLAPRYVHNNVNLSEAYFFSNFALRVYHLNEKEAQYFNNGHACLK